MARGVRGTHMQLCTFVGILALRSGQYPAPSSQKPGLALPTLSAPRTLNAKLSLNPKAV